MSFLSPTVSKQVREQALEPQEREAGRRTRSQDPKQLRAGQAGETHRVETETLYPPTPSAHRWPSSRCRF